MIYRTSNDEQFHVGKTQKGLGLFTNRSWKKGQDLFKLSGEILLYGHASNLAIQISKNYLIESYPDFNDYFANHSCDPNMEISFGKQLTMRAIKKIYPYDELTWDYETTEWDLIVPECSFACYCGSENCRKEIKGFKHTGNPPKWPHE
jgi:SET domain-containing protein